MTSDPERQARAAAILVEADEEVNPYEDRDVLSPVWGLWLQRSNVVRSVVVRRLGGESEQIGRASRAWWPPVALAMIGGGALASSRHLVAWTVAALCGVWVLFWIGRNYWRDERSLLVDVQRREMTLLRGRDALVTIAFDDVDCIHIELTSTGESHKELRVIVTVAGAAVPIAGGSLVELKRLSGRLAEIVGYDGAIEVRGA